MPIANNAFCAAAACAAMLFVRHQHAEGIDTEHIFGFMIGSDVGEVGEREFQSETTGRFDKGGGHYRAGEQELELELVPVKNFRIELGTAFVGHDIGGVSGLDERRQLTWQGASLDLRYRFLGRETAPFGMALPCRTRRAGSMTPAARPRGNMAPRSRWRSIARSCRILLWPP